MAFLDDLTNYQNQQKDLNTQTTNTINNGITDKNNAVTGLQGELGYTDTINGLNSAKRSLYNTQSVLDNLPTDVNQRLAGTGNLITGAQRNRVLASEQNPLTNSLNAESGAVTAGSSNLDTINNAVNSLIGNKNTDLQTQIANLNGQRDQNFNLFGTEANHDTTTEQNTWQAHENELGRQNALAVQTAQYNAQMEENKQLAQQAMAFENFKNSLYGDKTKTDADKSSVAGASTTQPNDLGSTISSISNSILPALGTVSSYLTPWGLASHLGQAIDPNDTNNIENTMYNANSKTINQTQSPFLQDLFKRFGDTGDAMLGGKYFAGYNN